MLEYCKTVLKKVSFDSLLFEKELTKSFKWLNESEKQDFLIWCSQNFKIPMEYFYQKNMI